MDRSVLNLGGAQSQERWKSFRSYWDTRFQGDFPTGFQRQGLLVACALLAQIVDLHCVENNLPRGQPTRMTSATAFWVLLDSLA